ncbi:MAG: hypothetical protein Q8R34_02495 [bacterium]|nr:hypothetical protein [bacterium]
MDDPKFSVPSNLPVAQGTAGVPAPKSDTSFRSSIRTMESDIKSAQTGQTPKAFEVKPPLFSPTPKPVQPPVAIKPLSPIPGVPPTGIKLGEAEKRTAPLPGQEKLIPFRPEQNPPVGRSEIKVAPATPTPPVVPAAPLPLPPMSPKQPPAPLVRPLPSQGGIAVPPKQFSFGNKKIMAGAALVVLIVLGGILYLRSGQEPEDISVATPTPSTTVSPELTLGGGSSVTTLSGIFGQASSTVFPGISDSFSTFQSGMIGLSSDNPNKNVLVSIKKPSGENYKFSEFLDQFSIVGFPVNLISALADNDFNLILTKQTEFFDENGKLIANPSAEMLLTPKIALAVRVIDATEARNQLTLWENTMKESFGDFGEFYDIFSVPTEKVPFSDNLYQGVPIRFLNFPYADKAIDYAIVTAKNGNDYLIIANSREQMYSIIDKLLGF